MPSPLATRANERIFASGHGWVRAPALSWLGLFRGTNTGILASPDSDPSKKISGLPSEWQTTRPPPPQKKKKSANLILGNIKRAASTAGLKQRLQGPTLESPYLSESTQSLHHHVDTLAVFEDFEKLHDTPENGVQRPHTIHDSAPAVQRKPSHVQNIHTYMHVHTYRPAMWLCPNDRFRCTNNQTSTVVRASSGSPSSTHDKRVLNRPSHVLN